MKMETVLGTEMQLLQETRVQMLRLQCPLSPLGDPLQQVTASIPPPEGPPTEMHFPVGRAQEADGVRGRPGAQALVLGFLELPEQPGGLVQLPLEHLGFWGDTRQGHTEASTPAAPSAVAHAQGLRDAPVSLLSSHEPTTTYVPCCP